MSQNQTKLKNLRSLISNNSNNKEPNKIHNNNSNNFVKKSIDSQFEEPELSFNITPNSSQSLSSLNNETKNKHKIKQFRKDNDNDNFIKYESN